MHWVYNMLGVALSAILIISGVLLVLNMDSSRRGFFLLILGFIAIVAGLVTVGKAFRE